MLGKETHQTPVRLVKGVFVPSTQPFFSENQLAKDSRDSVAPVVIPTLAQLWISPTSLIGPVSVQSTVLFFGTGSQTEQ